MITRKWIPVLLPFAVGVVGSNLRSLTSIRPDAWSEVLASIYYFPIVIAGITLGARATSAVALAAGVLHGILAVRGRGDMWVPAVAHTVLFVCVGLTTASLSEWLRATSPRKAWSKGASPDSLARSSPEVHESGQESALRRVVVGLARQFRTPLTSIEGAGWVLQDSRLTEEKRQEFVGIVRKEANRLNRVLSDALDFARPHKPRFQTVDLSPLVDEVVRLATPRDLGPFHHFRKDIPQDFPKVRCDPEQIRQVLLNLALNAIQAGPTGGQIEISARVEGNDAVIKVTDHGRGIPPEVLDKVFDPFFTTHENSLGLGLAVALQIVSEHGGKMSIKPLSGAGSCVAVTLPLG